MARPDTFFKKIPTREELLAIAQAGNDGGEAYFQLAEMNVERPEDFAQALRDYTSAAISGHKHAERRLYRIYMIQAPYGYGPNPTAWLRLIEKLSAGGYGEVAIEAANFLMGEYEKLDDCRARVEQLPASIDIKKLALTFLCDAMERSQNVFTRQIALHLLCRWTAQCQPWQFPHGLVNFLQQRVAGHDNAIAALYLGWFSSTAVTQEKLGRIGSATRTGTTTLKDCMDYINYPMVGLDTALVEKNDGVGIDYLVKAVNLFSEAEQLGKFIARAITCVTGRQIIRTGLSQDINAANDYLPPTL